MWECRGLPSIVKMKARGCRTVESQNMGEAEKGQCNYRVW